MQRAAAANNPLNFFINHLLHREQETWSEQDAVRRKRPTSLSTFMESGSMVKVL